MTPPITRILFAMAGALLLLAVLVWAVLMVMFGNGVRGAFHSLWGDDLAHLPRVPLSRLVTLDGAQHIALRDGVNGWFLVDQPQTATDKDLGFYGARFVESLFRMRHQPIYCHSDQSKILWVVQDNQIADALAFCKTDRMDLSALRPLAHPVQLEADELPFAEAQALIADVDADPRAIWVTRPDLTQAFSHEQVITLPFIWQIGAAPTPDRPALENAITDLILRKTGAARSDFTVQLNLRFAAQHPDSYNHLLRDGDQILELPKAANLWRPILRLTCHETLCQTLASLDYTPLLSPLRPDTLNTALLAATLPETPLEADWPIDQIPTKATLMDNTQRPDALREFTVLTRFALPR